MEEISMWPETRTAMKRFILSDDKIRIKLLNMCKARCLQDFIQDSFGPHLR